MNSYIITEADLRSIDLLNRAGIEWMEWENDSIMICAQPESITQALGAISYETAPSNWEDIFNIKFTFPAPQIAGLSQATGKAGGRYMDPALAKSRELYIEHAKVRHKEIIKDARRMFDQHEAAMLKAQEQFMRAARCQFAHEQNEETLKNRFIEEYKRLTALPEIKAVRWNAGEIQIYTNPLHAVHLPSGAGYALGSFLIIIKGEGAGEGADKEKGNTFLTCLNQTRTVKTPLGKMHAPYVLDNGQPAPHDLLLPIAELIGQMEYATAIELLLQLLTNAADDHLGNLIVHWPQIHGTTH